LRDAGPVNGPEFGGVTARYYARFRRGYPDLVVDRLVEVLGLDRGSRVLDLGCGPGQLALPLARRVGVVVGADPEPDMLTLGREAGLAAGLDNVAWLLAADSDLGTLGTLLGPGTLAAITVGSAFHWVDRASLLAGARVLVRPGGRVAVVTNGAADWEHDAPWAQVLRDKLGAAFDGPVRGRTGTDVDTQQAIMAALATAGFTDLDETIVDYVEERTIEELIGSLFSAMSSRTIERLRAGGFAADLAGALADVAIEGRLTAPVYVKIASATVSRSPGPARPALGDQAWCMGC
jgi:SAM-dependent methyltransferase